MARMKIQPSRYQDVLSLDLYDQEPTYCRARVKVAPSMINALYNESIETQKKLLNKHGFYTRSMPEGYVEASFKQNLHDHLKEFILKYAILGYLFDEIRAEKITIAGEPRLVDIVMQPPYMVEYHFEFSLFPRIHFHEWRYLPFRPPRRKNYKDLDRQVEQFLHEETIYRQKTKDDTHCAIGDWVNFSIGVVDAQGNPINDESTHSQLWVKIGAEEADKPFQELFLHKAVGDRFCQEGKYFHYYFNEPLAAYYNFCITIIDRVPNTYFCVDQFKHHFRLKTLRETHQKLIEVFSFRNDISLRRTIAQEALALIYEKNYFETPNYLILRQQKSVLDAVQDNPDYHVYRAQKDFKESVYQLAKQQATEQILIDQLSYHENMHISQNDLKGYLNLTQRPRMKEFLYFDPPMTKMNSQEFPIVQEELKRTCLREKTLNYVIHHLTRK
jgi:FKBP-type peptidyl-prolyl cis-trans isomerase (trigger factor)